MSCRNPGDGEWCRFDINHLANYRWISAEPLSPIVVTEDGKRPTCSLILQCKGLTTLRPYGQPSEEVTADHVYSSFLRFPTKSHGDFADREWHKCNDVRKDLMLGAKLLKASFAESVVGIASVGSCCWRRGLLQIDELLRIGHGEVSQQSSVHNAEDGCVRADAESQNQYRNCSKTRTPAQ